MQVVVDRYQTALFLPLPFRLPISLAPLPNNIRRLSRPLSLSTSLSLDLSLSRPLSSPPPFSSLSLSTSLKTLSNQRQRMEVGRDVPDQSQLHGRDRAAANAADSILPEMGVDADGDERVDNGLHLKLGQDLMLHLPPEEQQAFAIALRGAGCTASVPEFLNQQAVLRGIVTIRQLSAFYAKSNITRDSAFVLFLKALSNHENQHIPVNTNAMAAFLLACT